MQTVEPLLANKSTTGTEGIGTMMRRVKLGWLCVALMAIGTARAQTGSIALTADGTYQIAASGALNGVYTIDWLGPYRAEHYQVSVVAHQYAAAAVTILNSSTYSTPSVISNFRVVGNAAGDTRYFVVDVANRNGGTGSMDVTATGSEAYLALSSTPGGSTAISNSLVSLNSMQSNEKLYALGDSGMPGLGSDNTGLAWFGEKTGNNGIGVGYYYYPGQNVYGWVQSQFAGNIATYYSLSLNPLGGNIGIGTTSPGAKLDVNGNVKISGAGGNLTFADSTVQSTAWTGVLSGGDYAEAVDVVTGRDSIGPGDLVVIDPDRNGQFRKSAEAYSTLISGVYATKPGVVGRRQPKDKASTDEVPMAMIGIVPTKVSTENGPIRRGDLLVSASTPGYAMKGTDPSRMMGAVIGKALAPLDAGSGVIEVLISMQ
jgi:hypothetical protein